MQRTLFADARRSVEEVRECGGEHCKAGERRDGDGRKSRGGVAEVAGARADLLLLAGHFLVGHHEALARQRRSWFEEVGAVVSRAAA